MPSQAMCLDYQWLVVQALLQLASTTVQVKVAVNYNGLPEENMNTVCFCDVSYINLY